jgi:DNA ligase-4
MPIPFSIVCDLLEDCHKLCIVRKSHSSVVAQWFSRYRALIDAHDSNLVALLSTILPETRPDRVYAIQPPTLEKIVSRGLGLGHSRIAELRRYRKSGSGVDLADCVCSILSVTVMCTISLAQRND